MERGTGDQPQSETCQENERLCSEHVQTATIYTPIGKIPTGEFIILRYYFAMTAIVVLPQTLQIALNMAC